jgi:hypothetical protein
MSGCINFYLRVPVSCTRMRATMSLFRRNHYIRWIAALMSIVWLVAFASPAASFAEAICHDLSDIAQQQVASSANHASALQSSLKQTADADVCCKTLPCGRSLSFTGSSCPALVVVASGINVGRSGQVDVDRYFFPIRFRFPGFGRAPSTAHLSSLVSASRAA